MSHHTVTAALHYLVKLQVTAVDRGPRLQGSTRVSRASLHISVLSENLHAPDIHVRRLPAVTEHGAVGTLYAIVTGASLI